MKIGATADLHGYLPDIPADLDLLLIAGDIGVRADWHLESFSGVDRTVNHFGEWLSSIECPVVGIAGNHDFGLEDSLTLARGLDWIYLLDEPADVEGLTIHGSPWTPTYGPWAFMQDDDLLVDKWLMIPDDVDILITHGPPKGVMDIGHGGAHAGSETLSWRLEDIDPTLHVFGHIHGSRQSRRFRRTDDADAITANVAYVDEQYRPLDIFTFDI